jgi:ribonuclease J
VDGPAKQRRKLSFVGMVIATVLVDDRFELADDVSVLLDGVPAGLAEDMMVAAEKAYTSLPKPRRKDAAGVEDTVRLAIRRAAEAQWGKKPVVKVIVVRV